MLYLMLLCATISVKLQKKTLRFIEIESLIVIYIIDNVLALRPLVS
jgi:hypothetical protein